MPYFKVDQLFELSFSNKLAYVLPESVKEMLVELESCLEITDVAESTDKKEYKSSDIRRQHNNVDSNFTQKYRNRYDVDASTTNRGARDNHYKDKEKDRKKIDFRQKEIGTTTSEWRSSGGGGSKEESESDTHWEMMRSF
jgi:hypothetical protein